MRTTFKLFALASLASLGAVLAACSSDSNSTGTGGTGGTGGGATNSSSTTTSSGGSATTSSSSTTSTTGTGGTGGGGQSAASFVTHFDPTKGQQPEGLFITGNKAYVGYAVLGKIVTVDLTSGAVTDFGSIPTPPMNDGFMLGIAVDASGNVYVGFGGGASTTVKAGVYKIPAAGGAVTAPWATDPAMNFPNGLAFDASGNLFVADSGGSIFKIASSATVTKWATDPTLASAGSCMFGAPFPIGANGLVLDNNLFYVSNTNQGSILTIPVKADGSAGPVTTLVAPDCNGLGGIDGIASDGAGGLYGVLNSQNRLIHIGANSLAVSDVAKGMPLDNPASISIATVSGEKRAYFTNSAFFDMTTPAPGLLYAPVP